MSGTKPLPVNFTKEEFKCCVLHARNIQPQDFTKDYPFARLVELAWLVQPVGSEWPLASVTALLCVKQTGSSCTGCLPTEPSTTNVKFFVLSRFRSGVDIVDSELVLVVKDSGS